MTAERPDPRLGTDLGPYRIESVIGRGGMGVVYLAEQTELSRKVALKLLSSDYVDDEAFRARFLRESKLAAAIDHPNIIPIYDAGEIEGTVYLAMRFVEGVDLARRLRDGALTPRQAVSLLAQVAGALDAAHAAGLVHRDVKPANLLIASGQGVDRDDHVYLTDFGLTKQRGSQSGLTRGGSFLGTLEYVAPEQIEGKAVDGRADQYALAAVAVECLTGSVPFPRDSDLALINAHLRDAPPSLHARDAELPPAVDAVITRGLAKAPDDRYPDCRSFVDDLRAALGVTATQPRPRPQRGRDLRPFALVGVLIVGLLAVAAFAVATGGSILSSASPSASVAASSPPDADEPSPSADVFPSAAEADLLRLLPPALAAACGRGSYDVLVGQAGGVRPLASLDCRPPVTEGASEVVIRRLKAGATGSGLLASGIISSIADGGGGFPGAVSGDGRDVPPGDCATSPRSNGRWQRAGADVGALVCYTLSSSGDAYLWWSYDRDEILVKAVDQRGDSDALYRWFETNAKFIAP